MTCCVSYTLKKETAATKTTSAACHLKYKFNREKKNYICSFDRIAETGLNGNRIRELGSKQFNFNSLNLGVFNSSSLYLCSRQLLRFFPFVLQLMLIKV